MADAKSQSFRELGGKGSPGLRLDKHTHLCQWGLGAPTGPRG